MGFGLIKKVGGGIVDKAKDVGGGAIDRAKKVGGGAIDKAKDVGGGAIDRAKKVGGGAIDRAKDVGGDVVSLSREALEFKAKQEKNFANGVLDWGKDTVGTVTTMVSHPVRTAKAVGKLATNPVLNPIGGTVVAAINGKNPATAYKDGLNDLKDIGGALVSGYKDTYKEHGIAGLAGRLAPDVVLAVASGGSGTAAKTAGTTAAKAATKEVVEDVASTAGGTTLKTVVKDVAKDQIPGHKDIPSTADSAFNPEGNKNFLEAFIENFRIP